MRSAIFWEICPNTYCNTTEERAANRQKYFYRHASVTARNFRCVSRDLEMMYKYWFIVPLQRNGRGFISLGKSDAKIKDKRQNGSEQLKHGISRALDLHRHVPKLSPLYCSNKLLSWYVSCEGNIHSSASKRPISEAQFKNC